jgi:transposase
MNQEDLLTIALDLPQFWTIDHIDMDIKNLEVHVWLRHDKTRLPCKECNESSPVYDHGKMRSWRHLDLWEYRTYIHAEIPRVNCEKHGIHSIQPGWAEGNGRMTYKMESKIIDEICSCQNIQKAAAALRLSWDQVRGVMKRAIDRGLARKGESIISRICVDEKAIKKGHNYVTIVYNHDKKIVEYVTEKRKEESLDEYYKTCSQKQLDSFKSVSMDMWDPYINSTKRWVPDAEKKITHDKFHIIKSMNEAVNDVRIEEHYKLSKQDDVTLKGTKNLWLYAEENLPVKDHARFEQLKNSSLEVAKAWAMKENLRILWYCHTKAEAKDFFFEWKDWVMKEGLKPVIKVANMIEKKLQQVVNYCSTKVTNGPAEGLNSKIMCIKRFARGFRGFENFRNAIFFFCGGLDMHPRMQAHSKS